MICIHGWVCWVLGVGWVCLTYTRGYTHPSCLSLPIYNLSASLPNQISNRLSNWHRYPENTSNLFFKEKIGIQFRFIVRSGYMVSQVSYQGTPKQTLFVGQVRSAKGTEMVHELLFR